MVASDWSLTAHGNDKLTPEQITAYSINVAQKLEGGKNTRYEKRTKEALLEKAKNKRIVGRSKMTKDELIAALRAKQ